MKITAWRRARRSRINGRASSPGSTSTSRTRRRRRWFRNDRPRRVRQIEPLPWNAERLFLFQAEHVADRHPDALEERGAAEVILDYHELALALFGDHLEDASELPPRPVADDRADEIIDVDGVAHFSSSSGFPPGMRATTCLRSHHSQSLEI